jgi:hypothetical protein
MGRKLKGGGHVPKDVHSLLPLLNTTSSKKGGDYKVLVPRAHALCVALTLCRDLSNKRESEASPKLAPSTPHTCTTLDVRKRSMDARHATRVCGELWPFVVLLS